MDSVGHRWAEVTPQDHGGFVYIASFLCLTYTGLAIITRGFIKWRVLGFDDYTIALAQVAHFTQFALLMRSLSAGLAKNFELLSDENYDSMTTMQYGNQIALYISIGLSKCATILLTQRLFTRDMKVAWIICNIIVGAMLSWTVIAALLVSVGCSPESVAPFPSAQACPGIISRYTVVVATDVATDFILAIAPAYLVWKLQMSVLLKLQVLTVFSFRLPIIPFALLALRDWKRSLSSANPGVDRATAIVYQQSELCLALMAATIPCLTSFIRSFDTGSGVKVGYGSNEYGSSGRGNGESYKLSSMSKSHPGSQNHDDEGDIKLDSRPYPKARVKVTAVNNMSTSYTPSKPKEDDAVSHGSQELFIRRDVGWEVRSDELR